MSIENNIPTLRELLAPAVEQVQADLQAWGSPPDCPESLAEAMHYCLAGGKRLRPAMVLLTAEAMGQTPPSDLARRSAVAVEMIHVYSLVHDDLPAMDDDDLRRGRPTAHVKFGEAMAILIGDALQTRAFELLVETQKALGASLASELARAAGGGKGMVAGQVADMHLCDLPEGSAGLEYIHTRKTGAMLVASARMGAIAAGASEEQLAAVTTFAEHLGLAFQICDDLLDATATAEDLGKTPGKDAEAGKTTYLTVLGQAQTEQLAAHHTALAMETLATLGPASSSLNHLAQRLLNRGH